MRIEHDFLGQMELEDQAYYGIQTVRGVQNSNVTGHTYGEDGMKVVRAMARIKKAAALANEQIGALDEKLNENGYIVPGLGDAGDRIFGTK